MKRDRQALCRANAASGAFQFRRDLMTTEIPENVLTALKGIVEWSRSFDPDDDKLLAYRHTGDC
jgi:hypothetical protein